MNSAGKRMWGSRKTSTSSLFPSNWLIRARWLAKDLYPNPSRNAPRSPISNTRMVDTPLSRKSWAMSNTAATMSFGTDVVVISLPPKLTTTKSAPYIFTCFKSPEVQFRFYTTKDVRALSVKEITNVETFDTLNHPTVGGLYDQALGPSDEHDVCFTCNQPSLHCPGHMGHMELAMPVFNPLLFMTMLQDRSEDRSQHKQLIEETAKQCLQGKSPEQDKNSHSYKNVEAVRQSISSIFTKVQMRKNKKCAHCLAKRKTLRHEDRSKIFLVGTLADAPKEKGKTKVTNNQTGDDPEDDGDDEEEGDNSDTE
ncbi:RPA1-like protein [Mya arenaria]|uniref:DNA-directed RNA polymerase n=1 Tax=Mya arenaria TaxID=6604 RepID=A0ABY7EDC8_MYAAR|nr:RPA1-like protein [Mya arenaria]